MQQAGPCPSPRPRGSAHMPQQPWRLAGDARRSVATRPFLDRGRSIPQQTTQHGRAFSYLKAIHSCEHIEQEPCFPPSQMLRGVALSRTTVAAIVQPPPYPMRMPGQHRLGSAVSFAIFNAQPRLEAELCFRNCMPISPPLLLFWEQGGFRQVTKHNKCLW